MNPADAPGRSSGSVNTMPSFVFCLRADGSVFQDPGVLASACVNWLSVMHHTTQPVPGVWLQVPIDLLPEGVAIAFFNGDAFFEQVVAPSFLDDDENSENDENDEIADPILVEPPVDTRPIVSRRLQDENPEEWRRLWDLNRTGGQCDVCHEVPDVLDTPMNSDIPTRCTHWLCVRCWDRIARGDRRCPTCRDDLTNWLQRYLSDDEEEDISDDDTDE